MFVVYRTTNLVTGQFYIGMHKLRATPDNYLGSGVELKKNILEFGKGNFSREILREFSTEEDARSFETQSIGLVIDDDLCLNISRQSVGGYFSGCVHTEATLEKISMAAQKHAEKRALNRIQTFCGTCLIELWSKPSRVKKFCSRKCASVRSLGLLSDDDVKRLYLDEGFSARAIAERYGCSISSVRKRIASLEIFKRKKQTVGAGTVSG